MALRCPRCKTIHDFGPREAKVCACGFSAPVIGGTMTKRKLDVTVRRPPLGGDLPQGIRDIVEGGRAASYGRGSVAQSAAQEQSLVPDKQRHRLDDLGARRHADPVAPLHRRDLMHRQESVCDTLGRPDHGMALTDRRVHATVGGSRWCAELSAIRSLHVGLRRPRRRVVTGTMAIAGGAIGIMSAVGAWLLAAGPVPLVAVVGLASLGTLLAGVHRASSEATVVDIDVGGQAWSIELGPLPAARGHAFAANVLLAKDRAEDRADDRRQERCHDRR